MRERIFVLNDPHAMRISKELACEIGYNESVVLLQIEFLLSVSSIQREGRKWIKRSAEQLREEEFEWWSRATIWRAIESLERQDLLLVKNFNTEGFDRTRWFALNMRGVGNLKSVTIAQNETRTIAQNEQREAESGDDDKHVTTPPPGISQDEPAGAGGAIAQSETPTVVQDETASRESRSGDADRAVDGSEREDLSQIATSKGRDLNPRDLQTSPEGTGETVPIVNAGQILRSALKPGVKYSERFKGHFGKEISRLLDEGIEPDVIEAAAKLCIKKGGHPSWMPSLINEVRSPSTGAHTPWESPTPDDYADSVIQ